MTEGRARKARVEVFAVEDTTIQVSWSHLDRGEVVVRSGSETVCVESVGGAGAVTLGGLEPDRWHDIEVDGSPLSEVTRCRARTLPPLPGSELVRFATLSDLHIGSDKWDLFGRMDERGAPVDDIHTVRCARAAMGELQSWGAEHLLLKGDLTNMGQRDEWNTLGSLLAQVHIPVHAIPGNHDVKSFEGAIEAGLGAAHIDLDLITEPRAIDLPGLRVVMFDSTVPGLHKGRISSDYCAEIVDLLAQHDGPCLIATHHYPQATTLALFWPPGIPGRQARAFLDAVAAANPRTLLTSGHTHRHRRRSHGPVEVTEVGSPRDYPGTWGGYVVHEQGIRQVARRIEAPEAIAWNERTRRGALGAWGHWSPGRLDQRCFTHLWPT